MSIWVWDIGLYWYCDIDKLIKQYLDPNQRMIIAKLPVDIAAVKCAHTEHTEFITHLRLDSRIAE